LETQDAEYPVVVSARAVKTALPPDLDAIAFSRLLHPQVSVIIPVYNAERTIGEAIESVLRQSVTDWEIVVVDDGSTDASLERARIYAGRFPDRIFIERHPDHQNHGLSRTRNLGLARARASYICFLDADDIWLPGRLDHDISILRDHPLAAGVVGPALWWWDDESGRSAYCDRILTPADKVYEPPEFCLKTFVRKTAEPPCPVSWTFRRSAMADLPFDPDFGTYEDQKFLVDVSLRYSIYVSGSCFSEYRRSDNTLWQSAERSDLGRVYYEQFEQWLATATAGLT
jgi:glycosyltransferase involved in cell wall biosynthesis